MSDTKYSLDKSKALTLKILKLHFDFGKSVGAMH